MTVLSLGNSREIRCKPKGGLHAVLPERLHHLVALGIGKGALVAAFFRLGGRICERS
jgi:hypothetical protein